jgi:mycofactocin precursor
MDATEPTTRLDPPDDPAARAGTDDTPGAVDLAEDDLAEDDLVEDDLVEDDLVEEISIDGMCGVY